MGRELVQGLDLPVVAHPTHLIFESVLGFVGDDSLGLVCLPGFTIYLG